MRKRQQPYDTNRTMARSARLGKHWCMGCDAYFLGDGEKCKRCGYSKHRRDKRNETPQETPDE